MNKTTKILQLNFFFFLQFLGFRCSAVQVFGVLRTDALSLGGWCLMFSERVTGFIFKALNFCEDFLTLEYETSKLSRKFKHQISLFLQLLLIRSNSSVHN